MYNMSMRIQQNVAIVTTNTHSSDEDASKLISIKLSEQPANSQQLCL